MKANLILNLDVYFRTNWQQVNQHRNPVRQFLKCRMAVYAFLFLDSHPITLLDVSRKAK